MKINTHLTVFALALAFSLLLLAPARAETSINATNRFAYAANLGWMDWRGDTNNGVVVGEYVCSGQIYSANAGWINLGDGSPANDVRYLNNSAADFGVNHDGAGNLRGYAWGANIGWVNFEGTGAPKVNLFNGALSGYAWSANCGWISLSNAVAHVRADTMKPAPLAPNGLPAAWLLENFQTTDVEAGADYDNDGASNGSEYLAGTDPADPNDVLRITSIGRQSPPGLQTVLEWPGKLNRFYGVQRRPTPGAGGTWVEFYTSTSPGLDSLAFDEPGEAQCYRLRAFRPLMP